MARHGRTSRTGLWSAVMAGALAVAILGAALRTSGSLAYCCFGFRGPGADAAQSYAERKTNHADNRN